MVQQGGVSAGGQKITDPAYRFAAADFENGLVLKKGKKVFHKVVLK